MRNAITLMAVIFSTLWGLPALAQEDTQTAATPLPAPPETIVLNQPPTIKPATLISPLDGVVGHFGIGYFTDFAPLGLRYWFSDTWGLDLGFDVAISSGNGEAWRLGAEVGGVYALASYHYAVVFTRAGLGLRATDATQGSDTAEASAEHLPARFDIHGSAFIGAELFLGALGFPNISLQGGYGLSGTYTYQGGSAFVLGTTNGGLNVVGSGILGFHIYL